MKPAYTTQSLTRAMKDRTTTVLDQFMTDINSLFRICTAVTNFARSMNAMVREIELLAMNGVVHAAKITEGQGKPLLALGEILTDLPRRISPEVRELETWCNQVAKNTAKCSDLVRRFHQHLSCLLVMLYRESRSEDFSTIERLAALNLTRASGIASLVKGLQWEKMPPLCQANMKFLAAQCQTNIAETTRLLKASDHHLKRAHLSAENIKALGITARYLALYISVEAAALREAQSSFQNLASTINGIIDRLEQQFKVMNQTIAEGCDLLRRLSQEGDHEKPGHF